MQVQRGGGSGAWHGDAHGCAGHRRRCLAALSCAVASVITLSLPAEPSFAGGIPGHAVDGVSVVVAPLYPGAQANYFVDFKAAAGVAAGDHIFLSETAGPTGFSTETTVQVTDKTEGWQFLASGLRFGTGVNTRALVLRDPGPDAAGAMEVAVEGLHKGRRLGLDVCRRRD